MHVPTHTRADRVLHALVFGASGQIGLRVLDQLSARGWRITAVSRRPMPGHHAGVDWRQARLPEGGQGQGFDAIFSCGPLDLMSLWYAEQATGPTPVVAFGSTSVHVKADSPDPAERDLATRLAQAEERLGAAARERGAGLVLLRPTLVYGAGMDRNLSRIAALGRRYRLFPLPHDARGLRQPVHVEDLAQAALQALPLAAAGGHHGLDLPGGETLDYRAMVARVLAALQPPARVLVLPGPMFALAAALARRLGVHDAGAAVLARMRQDLVFDPGPARQALGWQPRGFQPQAAVQASEPVSISSP
jgi:nucleoside-diphosphate-sugar epimerase